MTDSLLSLVYQFISFVNFVEMKDTREEVKGVQRRELNRRIRFSLPKMELSYPQKEEICKLVCYFNVTVGIWLTFRFKICRLKIYRDYSKS
jgi:hypothetical protein